MDGLDIAITVGTSAFLAGQLLILKSGLEKRQMDYLSLWPLVPLMPLLFVGIAWEPAHLTPAQLRLLATVTVTLPICMAGVLSYLGGFPYSLWKKKLLKRLAEEDISEVVHASMGIRNGLLTTHRLEDLERMQEGVESTCRKRNAGSRKADDPKEMKGRIIAQVETTRLLKDITEKKARIAKRNDGELLTGETIKVPRNRSSLYAAIGIGRRVA